MKKIYIRPTIDFEFLEEDEILAASGNAREDHGENGFDNENYDMEELRDGDEWDML